MGQLKVQLVNEFLGPLVLTTDPVDINSLSKKIKRGEGVGVMYEVTLDLTFIKEGRDYLKQCYEYHGGVDSLVVVNIFEHNNNTRKWRLWGSGQVNFFMRYKVGEDKLVVIVEQKGISRSVLNLIDTDVNLETLESEDETALSANVPINVTFHSKKIKLQFSGEGTEEEIDILSAASASANPNQYIQFPFTTTFDEIAVRQDYPLGFSIELPMDVKKYNWRIKVGGEYTISIPSLTALIVADDVDGGANWTFKFMFVYGKSGTGYTTTTIYTETKPLNQNFDVNTSYDVVLNLDAGDEIYVYGHLDITYFTPYPTSSINYRSYTFDGPLVLKTVMEIEAATEFPETTVKGILLYEAFQRCLQYYTNQTVCFYSNLLGRTDLGYDADGKASLILWTNGSRLRGGNDKLIFANLSELIEFVNARFCIGYGFETVDAEGKLIGTEDTGLAPGTEVFRVEEMAHFLDKTTRILSLGRVYMPEKNGVQKYYYKEIIHGYSEKVDVKQINAIDEFMTIRKSAIPIVNTKNKLEVQTKVIGGGYQIESQRRLTGATEDGKHDDNNFVVTLVRDELEASGYRTRKGSDGYVLASFENIYDPESGYNYYLSPGRCRIAWEKYVAAGLIRSTRKYIKFSSGEVNYLLKSQDDSEAAVVEENGTSDLTNVEPIFDAENYNFTDVPFSTDQLMLIEANPYGYIDFEDQFGNEMAGFISDGGGIDVDPNAETADFELLKVHNLKLFNITADSTEVTADSTFVSADGGVRV